MPREKFETTILVLVRAKTVHALDREATVIGRSFRYGPEICQGGLRKTQKTLQDDLCQLPRFETCAFRMQIRSFVTWETMGKEY
jgi:hypothetical protein